MKTLASTFVAALAVQTVGAVDPYGGSVYLPPPRNYAATFTLWFMLGGVASMGQEAKRAAAALSTLVLLTMAVVGPFGRKALTFVEGVSRATAASASA